jgi:hypothetical protein
MTNRTHQFDDKYWLSFGKDVCVCAHVSISFCFFLFLLVSFHKRCTLPHEQPRSLQAAYQTVTQLLLLSNWAWRVMQHFLHACFVHKFQLRVNLLLRQQINGKCRYWSASVSEINKNCRWTDYTFPHFLGPTGTAATFNSALTSLCMESELVYLK